MAFLITVDNSLPADGLQSPADPLRRDGPAWFVSFVFHLLVLIAIGLVWQTVARSPATEKQRAAGIVLVKRTASQTRYLSQQQHSSTSSPATKADSAQPLANPALALDLPGGLPTELPAGLVDVAEALPAASSLLGDGRPSTQGGAQTVRTSVFGLPGDGNKFVYVFDRSSSMESYGGRPLQAAKAQLTQSLRDLTRATQFQIIFYNNRQSVFRPNPTRPASMLFGDEATVGLAEQFISSISGEGSTQHQDALKMALRLAPDVIFFLSDAEWPQMTVDELAELRKLNGRIGTSINAIEFGTNAAAGRTSFLRRLARQNNGQYVFVDVRRLVMP